MENLETEGRSLLRENNIFKVIYDKIAFHIYQDNPIFHLQAGNMQETRVFNIVK